MSSSWPQISPSGDRVAFIRDDAIHVRLLSEFDSRPVVGTEGAEEICWSPDSKWFAFGRSDGLYRVPSAGGGTTKICDLVPQFGFTWTNDDRIVVSNSAENDDLVFEVPVRGGSPRVLFNGDEDTIDYHTVASIPGTDVLLVVRHRNDGRTPIEARDGTRSVIVADMDDMYLSTMAWSPTGHVLFSRGIGDTNLWAVPFSPERMSVTGDPFLVMEDASSPSVSSEGTLAVLRGTPILGGELVWVTLDGEVEVIGDVGEVVLNPIVSPDGSQIAFARGRSPQVMDVWVRDLERGVNTRIGDTGSFAVPIAWSPGSKEVAVLTFDPGAQEMPQKTQFFAADGTGRTRESFGGLLAAFCSDWSQAVLISDPMKSDGTISAVSLDDFTVVNQILETRGSWLFASLDPTDLLLLYQSDESGEEQIFCTTFPSGEGRWQVSSEGGVGSVWAPDGSAVYYKSDDALYRVRVTREPELRFGIPERLFDLDVVDLDFQGLLMPAPDGDRFVGVRTGVREGEQIPQTISIVQNWFEEFRGGDE